MPEAGVLAAIERARTRLRVIALLQAGSAAAAVCAATLVALSMAGAGSPPLTLAVPAGVIAGAWLGVIGWRRWSTAAVAARLESAAGTLDNLVVTSVQVAVRPGNVLPFIREAVAAQAEARLSSVDLRRVLPATRAVQLFAVTAIGAGALMWTAARAGEAGAGGFGRLAPPAAAAGVSIDRVEISVTPPAYARLSAETLVNPASVALLAGSRVRIAVASGADQVALREPHAGNREPETGNRETVAMSRQAGMHWIEITADRSRVFALTARTGEARDERLVSLIVRPDQRPLVRLSAPGKDVMLQKPQPVEVRVEATDDLALQSVTLKYTRVSGSGESFTFEEGEVPLAVARGDARQWNATAGWAIDALKLEDGDALVYRAVARDTNPAGAEVSSESYLIEIGGRSGLASAGFALPEDDRRYAISQQMVIVKTERLQTERGTIARDEFADRARVIAVEQRMVKAEFIFLSGGEVEDEVVEAEQSHELVEGRLENIGRAEMLRAIAAMTRAEERLNHGDAAAALVHERAALQALQRAFDRRRYFLRVMPERARIDMSRRLSGSREEARSWARAPAGGREDEAEARERQLMADVSAGPIDASVAARVAAVDPASPDWQKMAQAMMTADAVAREQAVGAVAVALRARAAARLAPAAGALRADPYVGYLADAIRDDRRRR